jgi:putative ATPase
LHKAVRGAAPDAALYWLARLIGGGAEPLYVARRVVRMASEDVGEADPRALALALDAWEVLERLGVPEGELALVQAVVYMALAPKSNAIDRAWSAALADARNTGSLPVPLHLRNAPTTLMKELGHGRHYRFPHDEPYGYAAGERYFPDGMMPKVYYQPTDRGLEARLKERLAALHALDERVRVAAVKAGDERQMDVSNMNKENRHA